jgi:hypothetical protein
MVNVIAIIFILARIAVFFPDVLRTATIMETVLKESVIVNPDGLAKIAINSYVRIIAPNMANASTGNVNVNLDGKDLIAP